jgi:hypothetical protein
MGAVNSLSWGWIALMASVPFLLGLLVAYPIWRMRQTILGNLAGTAVIFGAALVLIGREWVDVERVTRECLEAGFTCWPSPSAFTRYAIYASIAFIEVFALFTLSLRVEEKIRRRDYAPEWREAGR